MGRPSLRDFLQNFADYEAPLGRKIGMAVANNLKKVRTRSECCGHPGHPGC